MSSHESLGEPFDGRIAESGAEEDVTLQELIELQNFLLQFRDTPRVTTIPGTEGGKPENDVEHSYFLAMAGWHVADSLQLPLNQEKILKYALVHDLPEAYAGDVDAFASHKEREAKKTTRSRSHSNHANTLRSYLLWNIGSTKRLRRTGRPRKPIRKSIG